MGRCGVLHSTGRHIRPPYTFLHIGKAASQTPANPATLHLGSATNPTPSACSTQPDKKTTTAFAPSHTPRPTSSSSASASHPPHRSRTSARSGFRRSTTIVPASHALSSAHRPISATTRRSGISWLSSACSRSAKKMGSVWRRSWGRSNTWNARR
jgi:hypothetical protein